MKIKNLNNNIYYNYDSTSDKIRLVYVSIETFHMTGSGQKIGKTFGVSSPFILPKGISLEESFKIISYLTEKVERENDIEELSEQSVALVSRLLENYGFKKVETNDKGHYHSIEEYKIFGKIATEECKQIEGCVDLFTIRAEKNIFKRTELKDRYFDWFTPKVKDHEINSILNKKSR